MGHSKCYSVGVARALISGASGLIGSALVSSLESRGCKVTRLVRRETGDANEVRWDPMHAVPPDLVSGFDMIIHLSGESVAGRWTEAKKKRIRDSRVVSTQNLSNALAKAATPPKTFISASAIGYYGSRGEEILNEESPSGAGFLAEVCRQWETATEAVAHVGIRTVNLRIGLVLSPNGGALKQMLLPFRLGLGGRIGSGRQWWSWIHIADLVCAVHHILQKESLEGPVNMTAQRPVTNSEFTQILGGLLKRPAILPVPAFAARLAFGEFADEGLLASARVMPRMLMESGFEFRHPELQPALKNFF
jgi:uncharacterized protein (TIGR01777 family)